MKQIHEVLRVGFEPGTYGVEVQHPINPIQTGLFLVFKDRGGGGGGGGEDSASPSVTP